MRKNAERLLKDLEERLKYFSELGLDFILFDRKSPSPKISPIKPNLIASLEQKILRCKLCPLSRERKNAVPGEGNWETDLMFVGEAPGQDEDIQGRPFVGRAGQLLTKIIEAMKFQRSEVYITNVVKCRPPGNRIPHREEIEKCAFYLLAQIKFIQPKVIVALGKTALDFFIRSNAAMTNLRGNFYDYCGIRVMPTFHPSYVIRNEGKKEIKRMVWKDMQKVMDFLGKT